MRAIILMFDSLNRHMIKPYADSFVDAQNFARLAAKTVALDDFYAGSLPCMPARREMHTGRYNFLHRGWGPLEPFDDSMPQLLGEAGVHTHLVTDHPHYWEDGGATYHTRYTTWEFFRGQEGDPWKGDVVARELDRGSLAALESQDAINRRYMPTEAEHYQTRTVDAAMEFLSTNAGADRWMLQIELFDPHEPFFAPDSYRDRYADEWDGPAMDWPHYGKVTEPSALVEHVRRQYAALVSMCDHSLGRVLDFMDERDMWADTLLIVNTDHGFLLGEHGWWAKGVQPWFNELAHLPMFLWDPRTGERGTHRRGLAQTVDIAPTLLGFFGVETPADMQGNDLAAVLSAPDLRETAIFGVHGGHVNITDGRYVYMRACADETNRPLEEYTLMPTHMRSRFRVDELVGWEPAEPFGFTKGLRTMRLKAASPWMNPWLHGTLLFDLANDPLQERPLVDDELELRMLRLLFRAMHENDAPASQFERLGMPVDRVPGPEHLLAGRQAPRAAASAEPLPSIDALPAQALLTVPVRQLLQTPAGRAAVERHWPGGALTELVSLPPQLSLLDLARTALLPAATLRALAQGLDPLQLHHDDDGSNGTSAPAGPSSPPKTIAAPAS